MVSDSVKIIASKFEGASGNTSTIFDLTADTTSTLSLTVPRGYVYYLFSYGGNSQSPGISVTIQDRAGRSLENYNNFPDSFVKFDYVPFIQQYFRDSVKIYFQNTSSTTNTITFFVEGVLIPERHQLHFEDALYRFVSQGLEGRECI